MRRRRKKKSYSAMLDACVPFGHLISIQDSDVYVLYIYVLNVLLSRMV